MVRTSDLPCVSVVELSCKNKLKYTCVVSFRLTLTQRLINKTNLIVEQSHFLFSSSGFPICFTFVISQSLSAIRWPKWPVTLRYLVFILCFGACRFLMVIIAIETMCTWDCFIGVSTLVKKVFVLVIIIIDIKRK